MPSSNLVEWNKPRNPYATAAAFLEILLQDLRCAFRTLRKDRGFTAIVVLILALGIAANIVVFSVVNAILLRHLPFPDSERLAWFTANHGKGGLPAVTYNVGSYEEFRRHNQSFEEVTAYQAFWGSSEYNMTGHGDPQNVQAVMVADDAADRAGGRRAPGPFPE